MKWYVLYYPSEEEKLNRIIELERKKFNLNNGVLLKVPFMKIKEMDGNTV